MLLKLDTETVTGVGLLVINSLGFHPEKAQKHETLVSLE